MPRRSSTRVIAPLPIPALACYRLIIHLQYQSRHLERNLDIMGISSYNRKIVRTQDGIQFEVESDEPEGVRGGRIGEFIDTRQSMSSYIDDVTRSLLET